MLKDTLHTLSTDTLPFGYELAGKVADKLALGKSIGYIHRDYCGMGMEAKGRGEYLYGELWDGYLQVPKVFPDRQSFVGWLSAQSTASLARLDDEVFFRGNQVITRERLEAFAHNDL